ncbi:hypothetical protein AC578_6206, partial [Pseudocercospora eumusae]
RGTAIQLLLSLLDLSHSACYLLLTHHTGKARILTFAKLLTPPNLAVTTNCITSSFYLRHTTAHYCDLVAVATPSTHRYSLPGHTTLAQLYITSPAVNYVQPQSSVTTTIQRPHTSAVLAARRLQQDKQLMLLDLDTDPASSYTTNMSSNSFYQNSPVVALPPAAPNQYFANSHYINHNNVDNAPMLNGISPNGLANSNAFASNGSTPAATPGALAGRKRSRGDIFSQADEEDEEVPEDGSIVTPANQESIKPRGKPVYGPGMTILYPEDPGYAACAESQSGTWVEEHSERKPFAHAKRPSVTSRKSQRMDSTAGSDDLAQLVLPPSIREATNEPLVDEATRRLGISFCRMDSSEARRINQKAYSKWIQNHYPGLTEVAVWFENSSIPGYIVAALSAHNGQHEYLVFSDDLTEARRITTDPSQLIPRLQMLPALEIAAPGGVLRAETDPITASQNEAAAAITEAYGQPLGGCAAHAMELD